jgi:cell division protein FtsN
MGVERYGSKTDVVVKLVLVFFIALLSFSVGTFVGKKFSDNQHKMAQLEPDQKSSGEAHGTEGGEESRGIASVPPEAGAMKPEKALTDDEIAKLAEEFVTDDAKPTEPGKMNDKHMDDHTQAKTEHGETATAPASAGHAPASNMEAAPHQPAPAAHGAAAGEAAHEVLKPAARMAEGRSAVVENPAAAPSRIPAALPKEIASSAIGKFTVQVGSFKTEKEAQTVSADLKGKGFSSFYVSAKVKGETRYRVSVGLFTTAAEADKYKKDLLARAKISDALVTKITSAE